ncbi:hypothetical protein ABID82_002248 [Methylobacterium sp. PvP062]|uniref:Uncharacterized protein n=1 Tax=Methylobacterium radiotolerans TaxID=31998 RepID=A0ABV2NN80_9HYPH|nr:hypothetical protein [Methylobacterium sp. PvP105]MBP2504709.1 hypothetical protein [Methylobacterium sp. PvP109]
MNAALAIQGPKRARPMDKIDGGRGRPPRVAAGLSQTQLGEVVCRLRASGHHDLKIQLLLQILVHALNVRHSCHKFSVVSNTINRIMRPAMTGWAETDDEPWVIGASVTQPPKMVRLQVWAAIRSIEGCIFSAALTADASPREYISTDVITTLIDVPARRYRSLRRANRSECSFSQLLERNVFRLNLNIVQERLEWAKFEDERQAHFFQAVRGLALLVALTNPFSLILQSSVALLLKEQKALAGGRVQEYSAISGIHRHWADLTFSEVLEDTVITEAILIPMTAPLLAGDYDDERMRSRRDDASLLLTIKSAMDVGAPIVGAPNLKWPSRHGAIPSSQRTKLDCLRLKIRCRYIADSHKFALSELVA